MKDFEYSAPRAEAEVLELLSSRQDATAILAGGTDLIGLMKKMIVTPDRVVNIMEVASFRGIEEDLGGLSIGATTPLDEVLEHPAMAQFPAIGQAIEGISSMQLQAQGTIGGELCRRPRCWYFRNGEGLLADRGQLVVDGDNRYHAILGNAGPAKFVSPSRLAPALIALGARVRIVGPKPNAETYLPLADFYQTPRDEGRREFALLPNQIVTHILLPRADGLKSGTYEVRHGEGPDMPLAAAAAALMIEQGMVTAASIVMGQVAPTPWVSLEAARSLLGRAVNEFTAAAAARVAVAPATPLKDNVYKVQLAEVAVKRAILLAAGLDHGGF